MQSTETHDRTENLLYEIYDTDTFTINMNWLLKMIRILSWILDNFRISITDTFGKLNN